MKLLITILLTLVLTTVQAGDPTTTVGAHAVEVVTTPANPVLLAGGVSGWERYNQMIKGSACNGNGVCETGEDCTGCPSDCVTTTPGASCGNGVCETGNGEDCLSCPTDCNGLQTGRPANQFCCGDGAGQNPVDCNNSACSTGGFVCNDIPVVPNSFCCGDFTCNETEDSCSCAFDCGAPPPNEFVGLSCNNSVDDDCDTLIDCADAADCSSEPSCAFVCGGKGDSCATDDQCCSNKCKGKRGARTCR